MKKKCTRNVIVEAVSSKSKLQFFYSEYNQHTIYEEGRTTQQKLTVTAIFELLFPDIYIYIYILYIYIYMYRHKKNNNWDLMVSHALRCKLQLTNYSSKLKNCIALKIQLFPAIG